MHLIAAALAWVCAPSPEARAADCADGAASAAEAAEATPSESAAEPGAKKKSAAEAMGRTPARIKCLDASMVDEFGRARARKGVQPRRFRKALRASLSLTGGGNFGDLTDTSWQAGGSLAFWISEDFGLDASFRASPTTFRLERIATEFTGQDRYPDGQIANMSYTILGHLLWAPLHTKLRARGDRIIHGDFVLFAGAGPTLHPTSRGVGFDLGASLYLYPTRWLSLRLDLSDYVLAQELLGSRRISNSLVLSAGLGLWIPFRR